jgi:hypothetical protein
MAERLVGRSHEKHRTLTLGRADGNLPTSCVMEDYWTSVSLIVILLYFIWLSK